MRCSLAFLASWLVLFAGCGDTRSACSDGGCAPDTLVVEGAIGPRSPQWQRPSTSCGPPTGTATSPYATHVFTNDGPARTYEVHLGGVDADPALTLRDPLVFVYLGGRLPADTTQCIGVDDDSGPGLSAIAIVEIPANSTFTVTATTFGSTDAGTYRIWVIPLD